MPAMRSSAVTVSLLLAIAAAARADETRLPNPVVAQDAPDPGVMRVGDTYYMVATSGNSPAGFPIRTSKDLSHWTDAGAVFPEGSHPAWAVSDYWAPEIHKVGSRYVCYYTARDASGRLCIGAATAASPLGPFKDLGRPFIRDPRVGMIDATFFEDTDGALYLSWKSDGNDVGERCNIYVQRLSPDGLALEGARTAVLTNDRRWEGHVVEGPALVKKDGYYYLFYSGNSYADGSYATGVARSTSPTGPFEKAPEPILHTGGAFAGPGHNSIVTDPEGNTYIVFHAYAADDVGGPRQTLADRVRWVNGWPAVNDGTPATSFLAPAKDPGLGPPPSTTSPSTTKPEPAAPPRRQTLWQKMRRFLHEAIAALRECRGLNRALDRLR